MWSCLVISVRVIYKRYSPSVSIIVISLLLEQQQKKPCIFLSQTALKEGRHWLVTLEVSLHVLLTTLL